MGVIFLRIFFAQILPGYLHFSHPLKKECVVADLVKVLIVDDDKTWQAYLAAALENYQVRLASNGVEAEAIAIEWQPETILLDIEMPVKNGYEACKSLKANPRTRDIPIIFLTSASSIQEKIAGFELGADDYLVKPCETALLDAKVRRTAMLYREKRELGERANSAQITAFEAMNSSADLGKSLRFAERTYAMNSFDRLAEGLFQTMAEFGLETSVMFITESEPLFYSHSRRDMSPLEQDMFLAVHPEGRFADFGRRTFCNFKLISLLIKNMPVDDPERYGRIKDSIPWVLGAADGKVGALNLHNSLAKQHEQVAGAIESLSCRLEHFKESFNAGNQKLSQCAAGLSPATQTVADTDNRSDLPIDPAHSYQSLKDQLVKNNSLGEELSSMLKSLKQLVAEQEQVNRLILKSAAPELIELGGNEIFSSGVDFF